MPKYVLPKEKKPKRRDTPDIAGSSQHWMRRVTLPANKAILDEIDTGDRVTVTLVGRIERTADVQGKEYKDQSFGMDVESVECYPTSSAKAGKSFRKGFKRGAAAKGGY